MANLVVAVSETDALLSVDGRPPEPLAGPIRLPVGPHHLTLTRAGFEPAELDVTIARGATFNTTVNLQATADTRDAYLARIHERRIWGWTSAGVGVAALATGVVLLVTGHSALNSANDNLTMVDQGRSSAEAAACATNRSRSIRRCAPPSSPTPTSASPTPTPGSPSATSWAASAWPPPSSAPSCC